MIWTLLQILIVVFTILSGIAALLYFNEKLRLLPWSKARALLVRVPRASLTASSIGAYVNTSHRSRSLDMAIADDFGATVARTSSDWEWLRELATAVGVKTVRDLDRLVKKHFTHARLLSRSFQATDTIETAHGVQLVLDIEAMRQKGLDGFIELLGSLKLTSAGAGFAKNLWNDYQTIVKRGT